MSNLFEADSNINQQMGYFEGIYLSIFGSSVFINTLGLNIKTRHRKSQHAIALRLLFYLFVCG